MNWINYTPEVYTNLRRILQHSVAEYFQPGNAALSRTSRIQFNRNQGYTDILTGFWRSTCVRQIQSNPSHFKYLDRYAGLKYTVPLSEQYSRFSDWIFLGVISVDPRLYTLGTELSPLTTQPVYEFMYAPKVKAFLDECSFIYLPVSNFSAADPLYSKVPYVDTWDSTSEESIRTFPSVEPLRLDAPIESFYRSVITGNVYHPFLPAHAYSGRTFLTPSKTLLYEYFDNAGYHSPLDSTVLSPERPFYLDFPLGVPLEGQLSYLESAREGLYPEVGRVDQIGVYTGYQTTESYHVQPWYLYQRQDLTVFLSLYAPTREAVPVLTQPSFREPISQYEVIGTGL